MNGQPQEQQPDGQGYCPVGGRPHLEVERLARVKSLQRPDRLAKRVPGVDGQGPGFHSQESQNPAQPVEVKPAKQLKRVDHLANQDVNADGLETGVVRAERCHLDPLDSRMTCGRLEGHPLRGGEVA